MVSLLAGKCAQGILSGYGTRDTQDTWKEGAQPLPGLVLFPQMGNGLGDIKRRACLGLFDGRKWRLMCFLGS